jgi:hypothetical protein
LVQKPLSGFEKIIPVCKNRILPDQVSGKQVPGFAAWTFAKQMIPCHFWQLPKGHSTSSLDFRRGNLANQDNTVKPA